mmetsp:Transcript_18335/g.28158  ORF Transcript_18335/g.28158 Transcript_18335/m.28158 type:complete len:85 (+) Transcript_18335:342-596(+)
MTVFKAGVKLPFNLRASEKCAYKLLHLIDLDDPHLISVDGIKDILRHFRELFAVDQDVRQVLDRHLIVHEDVAILVRFHISLPK